MATKSGSRRSTEEHRLRSLLDVAPDAMVVVDQAGRVVVVNSQTERLFGYKQDEILGRPVEVLIPERFRKQHQGHRGKFSAEPSVRPMGTKLELFGLRKDGTEFPVEISLSSIETAEGILATSAIRDLTERKRAEDAQRRCTAIVESSDDAIIGLDMNGIITDWNQGAERLFGYSASEAVGQDVLVLSPAEVRDNANGVLKKIWKGEVVKHHETVRLRKDGTRVEVSLTVSPIVDSHGSIVGASGIVRDITERKLAQEELANANERLHLAIESGSAGGWDFNLKTGKNVWFGEAHAQLGMVPGETTGAPEEFWERVHEEDREHLRSAMRLAEDEHNGFSEDFRVVWRNGTIRWLRSRGRYYYGVNGEPERMLGISVDITQSKQAEQALRDMNRALGEQSALLQSREELLKIFVKNVPAAVAMLDRDMHYMQVSDRWRNDYLNGRTKILGQSHYEIFPEMPDRWKEVHRRALQGETLRADEDCWDGQDGPRWARWEVRPWTTAEGAVGGILILAEDITRRKQMEEALSDLSLKLIEAQEQERARIARELHDDISQRLALLAIELDQLRADRDKVPSAVRRRIGALRRRMDELSVDIQALSYALHPSKLEHLGVVAGIKSWCKEFAKRQKIEVEFST